ncbi:Aste57867_3144 [Aphanomyces stellatus]|uniref:Aste57867_3144 protein n=1 Tax=Aphanomyces stellatus TaxID=120398 RepID=A0A485K930_9STRA|nr:hypothetical protein As57867_003135 [Aphanomyces stellatus]VFT80319.1 Aste57867_3144 [Aphanomyces stellatus]
MLEVDFMLDADEMRKLLECMRLRKYRADRKNEKQKLLRDVQHLESELSRLQLRPRKAKAPITTEALATTMLAQNNKHLRSHVENQARVARLLAAWVASHTVPKGIPTRASWFESTLVADPLIRRQGLQWLSERVYHIALNSTSVHPFGASMADSIRVQMLMQGDGIDGPNVGGSETHIQHTFFAPVQEVANVIWSWDQCNSAYRSEVAEQVDHQLVYYRGNSLSGANLRRVNRMFMDGNRVIITLALVAEDECCVMGDDELRIHGFAWTIVEPVTDSISLMRHSRFHGAPKTKHGVASVEAIAKLYMPSHESENTSHQVLAERLRCTVETMYTHIVCDSIKTLVMEYL